MSLAKEQLESINRIPEMQLTLQTAMKAAAATAEEIADAIIDGHIRGRAVAEMCGPGTTLGVLVPMRRGERVSEALLVAIQDLRKAVTELRSEVAALRGPVPPLDVVSRTMLDRK